MRRFLLLGVSLLLVLQAAAHAAFIDNPCPMQRSGHVQALKTAKKAHGCCNDPAVAAKTGKLCKTGQLCPLAGAWLTNQAQSLCFSPAGEEPVQSADCFVQSISPRGHWRPPALI